MPGPNDKLIEAAIAQSALAGAGNPGTTQQMQALGAIFQQLQVLSSQIDIVIQIMCGHADLEALKNVFVEHDKAVAAAQAEAEKQARAEANVELLK